MPETPDEIRRTWHLRAAIGTVLVALGEAESQRREALRHLPAQLDPVRMLDHLLSHEADAQSLMGDDYRAWLALVDRGTLSAGMLALTKAVEGLDDALARMHHLPYATWRWKTPLGEVIVDTAGHGNTYHLRDALLVVDVGGDDVYHFEGRSPRNRISVLLDRGGSDRYVALTAGADSSAAVLGYGILWDAAGDDQYEGVAFAQGAALLGAALHVDRDGRNSYSARSHAQAFAAGGAALLLASPGDDRFSALTHSQASAGPLAVAVLVDTGGNDHYVLGNAPVLWPSSQLPTHNVSMGQGAARGERGGPQRPMLSGGIGVLFDLHGDDHYKAQVFAQGAGYFEGVGLLIDGGGRDIFEAAWYAMGAAAHHAAGMLLKHGQEADRYVARHSTSLGAAHDFSVALFADEGGDDTYFLGSLGLGATHDNGVALFLDLGGHDHYRTTALNCNALGAVLVSDLSKWRAEAPAFGLFVDRGGTDRYESACTQAGNGLVWQAPQVPGAALREARNRGFGIDGDDWP